MEIEIEIKIKEKLKKYYIGSISRSQIISDAKNYLKEDIQNPQLVETLKLLSESSVKNNNNYNQIEENRLKLWPALAKIKKEVKIEENIVYLYNNIKTLKFENPDNFRYEYKKSLDYLIKEYLNDGMSEEYLIELVNTISFTNNFTKIFVYEFTDLVSTVIDIVDYSYYYLDAIDAPYKALWNLEEQLHKYTGS